MGEVPLSLHMDAELQERLQEEARLQHLEPEQLVQQAVKSYLDSQAMEREIMRARVAEADKGVFISEEAIMRWMDQLDDDMSTPPPKPDVFLSRR